MFEYSNSKVVLFKNKNKIVTSFQKSVTVDSRKVERKGQTD